MNRSLKIITVLINLAFMLSCISVGEKLKKSDLNKYNEIIGTWYILSPENPGDILGVVTFHDNGTISGDVEKIFGFKNAEWSEQIYNHRGWTTEPDYIGIYNLDFEKNTPADLCFNKSDQSNWKSFKNDSENLKYNSFYENYLSSLKILEYNYNYSNIITETYLSKTLNAIYTKDISLAKSINEEYLLKKNSDNENWEKLNKLSVAAHITFLKSVQNNSLKSIAETSLHKLLDQKVIKYIQKQFRPYSKYAENMIVFDDGMEICKLYEFLKVVILGKNNISGEKSTIEFVKNTEYKNGFDVIISFDGDEIKFTFKPYKNNLVIMGLSKGYSKNPNGWEYAVKIAAEQFNRYPQLDYIDVDLLENL